MQNQVRYIAVDDSLPDQLMLKEYAAGFPFLRELGYYSTPDEALVAVMEQKPDLIFLDIEMPGMNGVNILKIVRQQVPLAVFITSHPEFAVDGFELSAFDYILKPLSEERFAATARRLEDYWQMKQKAAAYEVLFEKEFVVIKEGYSQLRVPLHEIIYLEAMQDYTKVVTAAKSYLTLTTLTAFLEKLPGMIFKRVHRSFAVALKKITGISGSDILCGNVRVPVGKTYRSEIAQLKL